jgi:hypothetical protein
MLNLTLTCPQTGRPEHLACIADRDGEVLVVLRCSRFDPPAAIACDESCCGLTARDSCHRNSLGFRHRS